MNKINLGPQRIYTLFGRHLCEQRIQVMSVIMELNANSKTLIREIEMWLNLGQWIFGDVWVGVFIQI